MAERGTERIWMGPDGRQYWARIAPYEHRTGLARGVMAVCFETLDGRWVGSVPVPAGVTVDGLADGELGELLARASRMR